MGEQSQGEAVIPIFLRELETVFGWLLTASWQASVLALLVLLLQTILRGRLNPRWRYALWLLVIVRLLLPVQPESALSLFQFAPTPPAPLVTTVTEPWQPLFTGKPYPSPSDPEPMVKPNYPFSYFTLLTFLWLGGAMSLLALTWEVNRRFARQVTASPDVTDPDLLALFVTTKAELGISRSIRLIESGQVQSPAIMGLFQPTLLLPAHVREKFDARELRFIFLHELAHLKRGDVIVQALIALLQIAHWFNPVLWLAFRRMRIDREPATDAMVLSRAGEEEKERYGLMLIKLLEHFNQRHSLPTLVGILEDKDQFKRRFSLIARFTRGAYGWSLLGIGLITLLSIGCLTKSKAIDSMTPMHDAEAKQRGIAALVNHKPIFWADIAKDPVLSKSYLQAKRSGNELLLKFILQEAIDRELVIQDAESSGYEVPQSDLDERVNYGVKGFSGDKPAFVENLEKNGSSLEQFTEQNRRSEIYDHMFILNVDGPTKTYLHVHFPAIAAEGEAIKKADVSLYQVESTKLENDWMAGLHAKAVVQTFEGPATDEKAGTGTQSSDFPALTPMNADTAEAHFEFVVDHVQLHNLKVSEMPLTDLVRKVGDMLKEADPQKTGVPIELVVPPGEEPLKISYGFPPEDIDLNNLLYQLQHRCAYPIRYTIGDTSIRIEQLSSAEISFDAQARATKVDLHCNGTDAVTALKALQADADAKGFTFKLDLDALQGAATQPVTVELKQWSVERAMLCICYLAGVLPAKLDKFDGYRVSAAPDEKLHDQVMLNLGAEAVMFDANAEEEISDYLSKAQRKSGESQPLGGPSISVFAYPWTYRGKNFEPEGTIGGLRVFSQQGPQDLKFGFHYQSQMHGKTDITLHADITVTDAHGTVLGRMAGDWTAPSGTPVSLLIAGQPMSIQPADGGPRKVIYFRVRSTLVPHDASNDNLPLVPSTVRSQTASLPAVAQGGQD
jgi:beta-lactamase regulating signal transducer with metallopeptidase domain